MKITDETSHKALAYISVLSQQGYKLTVGELHAYIENLSRKLLIEDTPIERFKITLLKKESIVDFFHRLKWIKRKMIKRNSPSNKDKIELTKLGLAVLKSLNQQELTAEPSPVIVLKADDFLSYSRVISEISKYDNCFLADPYFRLDNLADIIDHTSCSRILTSEKIGQNEKNALAVALKKITKKKVEIRVSDAKEFHDRFIIPQTGPVVFLGTSINSVGQKFSVIGEISEPIIREIRMVYEKFWDEAECLK